MIREVVDGLVRGFKEAIRFGLERQADRAPGAFLQFDKVSGSTKHMLRERRNNIRTGRAYLKPVQTIAAGVPFGRPYNSPFAVR